LKHQIPPEYPVTVTRGEPLQCLQAWRDSGAAEAGLLLVEFQLTSYWANLQPIALTAIYQVHGAGLQVAVTDQPLVACEQDPAAQFRSWVAQHRLFVAVSGMPLPLRPTCIPKPWGQEIWYTGVEERGVCCFGDEECRVPIPWLQAVLPDTGTAGEALVLLKILDPLPTPVKGDLYFELHEEKREVYVVTRVDPQAWPDGTGYIRYGFDPARVRDHASPQQFRASYLQAVAHYESVRRELDALEGQPSEALLAREVALRESMNAFTHLRPLAVGDVVVVPLRLPHSLQHGVRTIEFQTPVYERKILSFAQQVLTQDH